MSNKTQLPMPVTEPYAEMLKLAIKKLGRNRTAEAAERDPSTVHRNINKGELAYGTAMEIVKAVNKANLIDDNGARIELPPPVVGVVNLAHYRFCEIGARLAKFPDVLDEVLRHALDKLHEAERDATLASAIPKLRSPK